ncbi:hypothetical protein L1887_56836 [Cichorium endivia]|nr:hypothetical protein L1887_56836 [Cichorium endivia]
MLSRTSRQADGSGCINLTRRAWLRHGPRVSPDARRAATYRAPSIRLAAARDSPYAFHLADENFRRFSGDQLPINKMFGATCFTAANLCTEAFEDRCPVQHRHGVGRITSRSLFSAARPDEALYGSLVTVETGDSAHCKTPELQSRCDVKRDIEVTPDRFISLHIQLESSDTVQGQTFDFGVGAGSEMLDSGSHRRGNGGALNLTTVANTVCIYKQTAARTKPDVPI